MTDLQIEDWGIIPYYAAYEKQKTLFEQTLQLKAEDKNTFNTLVLCEHPHVITVGKNGNFNNLLFSESLLKKKEISVFHINRGGDVTYHGPGQLVVYPILDLDSLQLGLKAYIYLLEEVVINLLSSYGIKAERLQGATGVWIDTDKPEKTRKICAIGVRTSRYVTMHGLALNANTDLDYFRLINPCGFVDKGVTSMAKELQQEINIEELKANFCTSFATLFCSRQPKPNLLFQK